MSEIRSFKAVCHKTRSLGVGRSVENSRELRPLLLVNIRGSTVLPSAQKISEKMEIFLNLLNILRIIRRCLDHKPELIKSSMIAQSFSRTRNGM